MKKTSLYISFYILLLILSVDKSLAQFNLPFDGQSQPVIYTVAGITVEGNRFVSDETIIALSSIYAGKTIQFPINPNNMIFRIAMQNLWERGQFSDVSIEIDKTVGTQLFLKIKVKEWNRLNSINISNNDKFDDTEIKEKIDMNKGDILTKNHTYLATNKIRKMYEDEGISLDSIATTLEGTDTIQYSNMNIYLEEGSKIKIKNINFVGNSKLTSKELNASMTDNRMPLWWEVWKSSKLMKNKMEEDLKLLETYCKSKGFIDVKIETPIVVIDEEKKSAEITINMTEGSKYYIRNINFEGNLVFNDDVLLRRLKFLKGDEYDSETFEANLLGNEKQTDVLSTYMDNGYLRANIDTDENRVTSDSVDINITIREYDRFKIMRVDILGNEKTKDKVIRRDLFTTPGDYFNRSSIIRSLRQLNVMNYFNPEKLKPEIEPSVTDATEVNVKYNVEERGSDTFNASVGYAGSYGLMLSAGMTFNNFSITEPFKGGGGQVLNFNVDFGQASRYKNFTIGLTEPWLFDKPITLGFVIYSRYQNYNTIHLNNTGASLNFGKRFKWPDDYWRGDWFFRTQWNDNQFDDNSSYYSSYYKSGKYSEITLEQRFSRISKNNMFFPSQGSEFSLRTAFAMGSIGVGETDFLKNELNYSSYSPIWKYEGQDRVVFALSTTLGYITNLKLDSAMNQLELYRMGGNGLSALGTVPLRGYEDNTIGDQYGNQLLSKYSAELRFAVALDPMPVYVYAFAEAGNVWSKISLCDPLDLKRSAGIGVQLFVNPIGIIGFSYGYGFDNNRVSPNPSGWKFLFHLGNK